jgi:hypothetical protein
MMVCLLKRKGRSAEGAFGEQAAEIPMSTPASGAVVNFIIAIHGVVPAHGGIEGIAAGLDQTQHGCSFLPFRIPTSDESLGFGDNTHFFFDCSR